MTNGEDAVVYVYEERVPEGLRKLVREKLSILGAEIVPATYRDSSAELIEKFSQASTVLLAPGRTLPREVLEQSGHLKLLQLWSSGYDKFNIADAAAAGIPVANNGGANATSVAEHTMLLMLAAAKKLPEAHWRASTGNWAGNSHGLDMFNLRGKTLGILGLGNIGSRVAAMAHGFGMRILYHDRVAAPEDVEQRLGLERVALDELLRSADVLTLHLHLNAETEGIIDAAAFGKMKNGAVLINVSRAQLVDQQALLRALNDGKLSGAGLDVFMSEPTTAEDPLAAHPRVVVTPHMAGSTLDAYHLALDNCVSNLTAARRGEALRWVVNGVDTGAVSSLLLDPSSFLPSI